MAWITTITLLVDKLSLLLNSIQYQLCLELFSSYSDIGAACGQGTFDRRTILSHSLYTESLSPQIKFTKQKDGVQVYDLGFNT